MKLQLWTCNYDPETMGIGPLAGVWAREMVRRGNQVEVVAAHPHYPDPVWGRKRWFYSEVRDGIPVRRVPPLHRAKQHCSTPGPGTEFRRFPDSRLPFLGRPDAIVSTSPSFPALLPGMAAARFKRIPWFIWLQDILPDGAVATGYLENAGLAVRASRRFESAAYKAASGVVVLSESFRSNLLEKGVPDSKITVAYNPATIAGDPLYGPTTGEPRILCMGNIGRTQGLPEIVRDFEGNPDLAALGARLVIAGSGVAEDEVKSAISTDRVEMTGLLDLDQIKEELRRSSLTAVTQAYDAGEFNVPSKLMNYLAAGVPVVASVRRESEACRIVEESGAGWVADPGEFGSTVVRALSDPAELKRRSERAYAFAQGNLTAEALGDRFEEAIARVI